MKTWKGVKQTIRIKRKFKESKNKMAKSGFFSDFYELIFFNSILIVSVFSMTLMILSNHLILYFLRQRRCALFWLLKYLLELFRNNTHHLVLFL